MNLSETIECRHCGNISKMEILGTVDDLQFEEEEHGPGYSYGTKYDILKCPAPKCNKITVASYSWHEAFEEDGNFPYKFIYPQSSNNPIGLPDKISTALRAAEKVKSIDVNAYATLIRRLLEMICIDRNAKGNSLSNMLKELATKNEIPEKLVKVAMGIKDFGNIGAHAGIGELTEKEVPILSTLCNAILEYVYSAPYLATLAEEKLKEIKVKKIK
ncbi:MAG TPA: DUF4145 domain-containing protein [Mucilaginibacter sp.]